MNETGIRKCLLEVGTCEACISRFLGKRKSELYFQNYVCTAEKVEEPDNVLSTEEVAQDAAVENKEKEEDGPTSNKRVKKDICICCLGLLQSQYWPASLSMAKKAIESKGYDSPTFACALSAPVSILLREKSLALHLESKFPDWSPKSLVPLKEAWRWCVGPHFATAVSKILDSGAVAPLLITLNMEYSDDLEELNHLHAMSPAFFAIRHIAHRKYRGEDFTRRSVEQVLEGVERDTMAQHYGVPPPEASSACRAVGAVCEHAPVYLGGRYKKMSRQLSQTPWVLNGKRMMESSVQDVIFKPVADLYQIEPEQTERRLKLISAGREDVDVRCLGEGRPFVVEVSDPHLANPTSDVLQRLCERISESGVVRVDGMVVVDKNDLTHLKSGEEHKTKTYTALCIKLPHSQGEVNGSANGTLQPPKEDLPAATVTEEDITKLNSYSNDAECRVLLQQRTPLRVLHRRPLLTRARRILELRGEKVPNRPNLFILTIKTEAGTYVKEFVHGDFGRTKPCIRDILDGTDVDILALDVTSVDLVWPLRS